MNAMLHVLSGEEIDYHVKNWKHYTPAEREYLLRENPELMGIAPIIAAVGKIAVGGISAIVKAVKKKKAKKKAKKEAAKRAAAEAQAQLEYEQAVAAAEAKKKETVRNMILFGSLGLGGVLMLTMRPKAAR